MTAKAKIQRTPAKRTRRKNGTEDRGEIVSLNVYLSQDPRNGATKEEFLGEIPDSETYREEAARTFGGNRNYLFVPRFGDGTFGASWPQFCPEVIEGADEAMLIEDEAEGDLPDAEIEKTLDRKFETFRQELLTAIHRTNPAAAPQTSIGEIITAVKALDELRAKPEPQASKPQPQPKSLLEQLRELKEVKALLVEDERPQTPTPAPLTPELVLAKAIVENPSKFGVFTERLMAKVLGDEEPDEAGSWAKVLAPLVTQVADNLPGILQTVSMGVQMRQPVMQNGQPGMPHAVPATPHDQPTPEQAAPPADIAAAMNVDPMQAYQHLIGSLLTRLEQNAPTSEAAAAVNAFILQHPQFEEFLLDFVQMPTPQLLATLGQIPGAAHLPALPHAAQWLDGLRAELLTDEEGEPEPTADS